MHAPESHATGSLAEAGRLMTICNACRYCEGLCAVFPAMELRRSFGDGELNYLANLCHSCGACYSDCQFAPPHEFAVNLPQTLAAVRAESYQAYAWPAALRPLFERNGLWVSLIAALAVALFLLGFAAAHDPAVLFAAHSGPGAFYRLMSHELMVTVFGAAFLYALLALALGFRNFWRDGGLPRGGADRRSLRQALGDAARLRYLDGGGVGCMNEDERPSDRRRLYHHLVFYGFLLCLASTSVATLYHYLLGLEAPYAWYDLPVVLGTLGGFGIVIGCLGLFAARQRRDPMLTDRPRRGMDTAFLVMLFLTALTGLLLLFLRATPAMSLLLALHLGVVFGFFVTLPYGKFVHGLYRFGALVRYARERPH